MNFGRIILACALAAPALFGQLTVDQKVADFMQLSGIYAKNYAPYEWKKQVYGFDLLDTKPWIEKVKASKTDLEFLEICAKYVASLKDSHDELILPSDFIADLGVYVDVYDGKLLVDGIDRSLLPKADFPIAIADELVSLDGVAVAQLLDDLLPYAANGSGNEATAKRQAAGLLTYRWQGFVPSAPLVGESAVAVFRSPDGTEKTLTLPWTKSGTAYLTAGPVPGPAVTLAAKKARLASRLGQRTTEVEIEEDPGFDLKVASAASPALQKMRNLSAARGPRAYIDYESVFPVFDLPLGFKYRLGLRSTDNFLSGTWTAGGKKLGYIRIPHMSPSNQTTALNQFASEMIYLNTNTDGLVIDLMANGGGDACYTEALAALVMARPFRSTGFEIRATQAWVYDFSRSLTYAKNYGTDDEVAILTALLRDVKQAMSENRGRTGALPLCGPTFEAVQPFTDASGKPLGYTKPVLVLSDEITISAGEMFGSILQDEGRAVVMGKRSAGGGGAVFEYPGTTYSEATTRVTINLMNRGKIASTPGFPAMPYVENIGVFPDIDADYMTADNLINYGATFVDQFTAELLKLIQN